MRVPLGVREKCAMTAAVICPAVQFSCIRCGISPPNMLLAHD